MPTSFIAALIGLGLLLAGLLLDIHLLWVAGVVALVVALVLFILEHSRGRRRTRL